jgi:prepilin signal peptidase PulO-like enzyme (type II secretory pathway)
MFIEIMIGVIIAGLAMIDIFYKKIPLILILLLITIATMGVWITDSFDLVLTSGGAVVGLVFVGVSKITKEGIGYGDSLLILALGIYMGFWKVMILAMITFLLSAVFAVALTVVNKKSKKATFPLIPFIACSFFIVIYMA